MTWLDRVREVPVEEIAGRLGMEVLRRSLTPCPACGANTRERGGRRGPIGVRDGRWRCFRCGAGGDAVTLVTQALFRERLSAGDPRWADVRRWFDGSDGGVQVAARNANSADTPPPAVAPVWERCVPVTDDAEVCAWLTRRALDPAAVADADLARALPRSGPLPGWAAMGTHRPWTTTGHRLVLPLYNAEGALASMKARYIGTNPRERKSVLPMGGSARGMVMADASVRDGLANRNIHRLLIVEGDADYLTWAVRPGGWPVMGVFAGAWDASFADRVADDANVVVRTHADAKGDEYAAQITTPFVLRGINTRRALAGAGE